MTEPRAMFTVGHSNHPFPDFAALLELHRIALVADVRSVPYSRRHPQFNRRVLEDSLDAHAIGYLFLGAELGARTSDPSCYDAEGRVRFSRLAMTDAFLRGIERALQLAADARLALLCAERDPANCHRTMLVAPALAERGVSIVHILADGSLETQEHLLDRLCSASRMPPRDIFRSRAAQRKEALARRAREIAFVDPERAGNRRR
jgi:uncharacterized protein (DUF488 family)